MGLKNTYNATCHKPMTYKTLRASGYEVNWEEKQRVDTQKFEEAFSPMYNELKEILGSEHANLFDAACFTKEGDFSRMNPENYSDKDAANKVIDTLIGSSIITIKMKKNFGLVTVNTK